MSMLALHILSRVGLKLFTEVSAGFVLGIMDVDPEDLSRIVSEYDQEIPQSQTADNLLDREEGPLNHHETPGRQIKQSNQLSLPHQDDCNTRTDIK